MIFKNCRKDLDAYSLETVEMFYRDATAAGYSIATTRAGVRSHESTLISRS